MKRPIPFGKYYLLERINVGGMAEVFRAKTYGVEGFERFVAVKKILPNIAEDEEFISMFIDEAKIAVQLNHANIAQIFDLGKVDGSYFIALEYINGKDVRGIWDRCQAMGEIMPISQACFIIMKVCEGLDYAHNKRNNTGREMHLVHRDVSPQNILISFEGEVKLVDFGIAKAVGKASKTQAGILKGKFGYMSPEQVRGMPLDRRSDIFSVGICLYELITGERLFQGESDFSTLEKVRNVEILPPSTYNRKIPEELEQIVLRALSKDAEDRYEYAIDLHDDLQAFMYSSGSFYSRKDLAAWMKSTYAKELGDESRKMEEFRKLAPPEELASGSGGTERPSNPPPLPGGNGQRKAPAEAPPLPVGGVGQGEAGRTLPPPLPPPPGGSDGPMDVLPSDSAESLESLADAGADPAPSLTWDDDEVDTQIWDGYDDVPDDPLAALAGKATEGAKDAGPPPMEEVVAPIPSEAAPALNMPTPPLDEPKPDPKPEPEPEEDLLESLAPVNTGLPAEPRATLTVPPLDRYAPPPLTTQKRKGNKLGFWIAMTLGVLLLCGGALYYFLVYARQPGAIEITAAPADVAVSLDGKEQPSAGTPLTIDKLKPGFYVVSAFKPGFDRWTKTVEVRGGKTTHVKPALLAQTSIKLYSNITKAEAYLNGRKLPGMTPMRITRVVPGPNKLEVRKADLRTWVHEFTIRQGDTMELHAALVKPELSVSVKSKPAGDVSLVKDGQRESKGATPVSFKFIPDPNSIYSVVVVKDGYAEKMTKLDFAGKEQLAVDVQLTKPVKVAAVDPKPADTPPVVDPKPLPEPKPAPKPAPKPVTFNKPKPGPAVVLKPDPAAKPKPKPLQVLSPVGPAKPVAVVVRPKPKPLPKPLPKPVTKPKPKPAVVLKPDPKPKPKPVSRPKGKGWLLLGSTPWAQITIDGNDTGLTTPKKLPLSAGRHTIRLRNPKFGIDKTFKVVVKAEATTKVIKRFPVN